MCVNLVENVTFFLATLKVSLAHHLKYLCNKIKNLKRPSTRFSKIVSIQSWFELNNKYSWLIKMSKS